MRDYSMKNEREDEKAAWTEWKKSIYSVLPDSIPKELRNAKMQISDETYVLCYENNGSLLSEVYIKPYFEYFVQNRFDINFDFFEELFKIKKDVDVSFIQKDNGYKEKKVAHVLENLFPVFISKKQWNENLQKELPHREWGGSYIAYRYVLDSDNRFVAHEWLDYVYMNALGLSEGILFTTAKENCSKFFSVVVDTSKDVVLYSSYVGDDNKKHVTKHAALDLIGNFDSVILPNTILSEITVDGQGDVTQQLYKDFFSHKAEYRKPNYYLVPFSSKEVLMMPEHIMKERVHSFHFGELVRMLMNEAYKPEPIDDYVKGTYIFKPTSFELVPCSIEDICQLFYC